MINFRDLCGVEKTWLHDTLHFTNLQVMFTGAKRVTGLIQSREEISLPSTETGDVRANESAGAGPLRGLRCVFHCQAYCKIRKQEFREKTK